MIDVLKKNMMLCKNEIAISFLVLHNVLFFETSNNELYLGVLKHTIIWFHFHFFSRFCILFIWTRCQHKHEIIYLQKKEIN